MTDFPNNPDRIDVSLDLVGPSSLDAVKQLTEALGRTTEYLASIAQSSPEARVQAAGRMANRTRNPGTGVNETAGGGASTPDQAPGVIDAHGQGASTPNWDGSQYPPPGVGGQAASTPPNAGIQAAFTPDPGGPVAAQRAEEQNLRGLADESFFHRLRGYGTVRPGEVIRREVAVYGAREREQAERRGPSRGASLPRSGQELSDAGLDDRPEGSASAGASTPFNDSSANDPTWRRSLMADRNRWESSQEGFTLPRFGELTIQDKLNMASDFMARSAERAARNGLREREARANELRNEGVTDPEALQAATEGIQVGGGGRGYTANLLRMGAEQVPQALTAYREASRLFQYSSGLNRQGIEAGFERGGQINIPGTSIGIQNPFDAFRENSAFREAINQRINVQRLRAQGGITGDQAQQIVGGLAGMGWTGEFGQNIAFDAAAPLVQQGQSPESVLPHLDQALRNGDSSMREIVETLSDLGPSARAANMSLTEYSESLRGFAEWAQQNGATYTQGVGIGRNLSSAYGVSPQQAQTAAASPITTSMAMYATGAMPNEVAAVMKASPSMAIGLVGQSLQFAQRMAQPFAQTPLRDRQGRVILSGRERGEIQAAAYMGVDLSTYRRMQRSSQIAPHIAQARDAWNNYARDHHALQATKGTGGGHVEHNVDIHPGDLIPSREGVTGAFRVNGTGDYVLRANNANHGDVYHVDQNRAGLQGEQNRSWNVVANQLRAIAPKSGSDRKEFLDEVRSIGHESDIGKRKKRTDTLMAEQVQKSLQAADESKVHVAFTGAAAKYFQELEKRGKLPDEFKTANATGTGRNDHATSAMTQTDINDLLNTVTAQYAGGG